MINCHFVTKKKNKLFLEILVWKFAPHCIIVGWCNHIRRSLRYIFSPCLYIQYACLYFKIGPRATKFCLQRIPILFFFFIFKVKKFTFQNANLLKRANHAIATRFILLLLSFHEVIFFGVFLMSIKKLQRITLPFYYSDVYCSKLHRNFM